VRKERRRGRIQHIYLDELDHGIGVSPNALKTHVLRLIARPVQPWLAVSPDVPFPETARDQASFWETKFREMKLEVEPRPRLTSDVEGVTHTNHPATSGCR